MCPVAVPIINALILSSHCECHVVKMVTKNANKFTTVTVLYCCVTEQ